MQQRFTWEFAIKSKLPLRFVLLRRAKLVLAKTYGKFPNVPLMLHLCPSLNFNHMLGSCQSIGSWPVLFKNSFTLEKGLLPKKPRKADKGLGWGLSTMK